ncbi:MAG: DUF2946 family protein [Gammaproteobacteria bacterium]|nr:DUF2946 family protein [Gammaproteobacteria bacterium]
MINTPPEKIIIDKSVQKAMAKWPDVPECFGWLSLNRRAEWSIKGEKVHHTNTQRFLQRNYNFDNLGRWFVQNGPQRAFVSLEYTPRLYGFSNHSGFYIHDKAKMPDLLEFFLDEYGNLLLSTALGVGVVDDRDLSAASDLIETVNDIPTKLRYRDKNYKIKSISKAVVPQHFGFVLNPKQI